VTRSLLPAYGLPSSKMRLLLVPFRTLATLLSGFLATLVFAPLAIVVGRARRDSPWIDRFARSWSRAWLAPAGCRLEVSGRENVDTTKSYVVVANHLSNFDVMACFLAVPLSIRYLAKKELFKVPLLAPAMRAVGIVEVDRDARSAIHTQVNTQSKAVLSLGRSLIIYPEGTRSRSGELQRFKKGAFTMAVSNQIPVLPVTIQGSWEAWRPDRPLIFGGPIRVVIDPPLPTEGLSNADAGALMNEARAIIERRIEELRAVAGRS